MYVSLYVECHKLASSVAYQLYLNKTRKKIKYKNPIKKKSTADSEWRVCEKTKVETNKIEKYLKNHQD